MAKEKTSAEKANKEAEEKKTEETKTEETKAEEKPKEIAELMGVPAKDISTILCRAKKSARKKLDGEIRDDYNLAA